MKVYRRHPCSSYHRTTAAFLRCTISGLEWIRGDGAYALVAWCGVTISLHQTEAAAEDELDALNAAGCGHACKRRHEVIRVDLPTKPHPWARQ